MCKNVSFIKWMYIPVKAATDFQGQKTTLHRKMAIISAAGTRSSGTFGTGFIRDPFPVRNELRDRSLFRPTSTYTHPLNTGPSKRPSLERVSKENWLNVYGTGPGADCSGWESWLRGWEICLHEEVGTGDCTPLDGGLWLFQSTRMIITCNGDWWPRAKARGIVLPPHAFMRRTIIQKKICKY
jgi:hypothetical protein